LTFTIAHPSARNSGRQSLEFTIEKWEDTSKTLNSSVLTESVSDEVSQLPKSIKDFLQLLGWGLKLFGDALASLLESQVPTGAMAPGALLTDVPSLASLVPHVPTTSWHNTSRPAPTSVMKPNSTSYLTVKTTRVFTVTAPRTTHLTRPSLSAAPSVPATSPLALKQSTLPFEKQNIVQVYVGRYPGIARTITDLNSLCASPNIDIITLAGVTTYFAEGAPRPLPIADFDGLCNYTLFLLPSGTDDCAALSTALRECQTIHGKKLFLAIEAGTDTTTLRSAREAATFASVLWDTFGAGRSTASGARKYGGPRTNALGIAFDGFEFLVNTTTIDNEYFAAVAKAKRQEKSIFVPPTLPYFDVLFDELRQFFTIGDSSKPYYLSVSLPCTRPSIISRPTLEQADFVSVRFMDDIACNINGLAFSNFLSTWGKDIADTSASDRVGFWRVDVDEGGSGMVTSGEDGRTVVRSLPRTRSGDPLSLAVPSAINPGRFTIPRYTPEAAGPLPSLPERSRAKRHDSTAPHFLLGIPVPSLETQNATAQSGVGSADPATLTNILQHAKAAVSGFAGVLLWGGVRDLEVGDESGYLGFVKGVLDGTGPVVAVAGPPSLSSVMEVTSVKVIEVSSAALLAAPSASAAASVPVQASARASVSVEEAVFSILPVFETVVSPPVLAAMTSTSSFPTRASSTGASRNTPSSAAAAGGKNILTIKSTRTSTTTIARSASPIAAPSET
jgi:hypothetical protein